MEQRHLGRTGLRVSRLALGTMQWGRDTDQHEAREQLESFVEVGGTLLDTAAGYADGDSEAVIGALLGKVVGRDDVVIATKAGIERRHGERVVDVSRRGLLDQLDGSLGRLGVDHVDLWQIHTYVPTVPLEETLSALDYAWTSGRARYVGVSNYGGWQTGWAVAHQEIGAGQAPIVSTQVEYSLVQRCIEREVVPAVERLGLGLLAWSPLGRGVLTGKYRSGTPADSRAASPHFAAFVQRYLNARARRIVEAVCTAADGLGISPVEVALAWVRDQPGVTAPILGARTVAQLRGALSVEDVILPAEIRTALDDISAIDIGYPERAERTR